MANIFVNGVFDMLHAGHVQLLSYCRWLAGEDSVIVGIDSDVKVAKDKGKHRPYYSQSERRAAIIALTTNGHLGPSGYGHYLVDWVEIFSTDKELHNIIKNAKPDYIVKGEDWKGKTVIGSDIAQVHFAPTYMKNWFSTTTMEARVKAKHGI